MKYDRDVPRPGNGYTFFIDDAVTKAERLVEWGNISGAMYYLPELDRIIGMGTWRAEAAADVRQMIVRQAAIRMGRMFDRTTERSTEFDDLLMPEDRTTESMFAE